MKHHASVVALGLLLILFLYSNGLDGPFLFDDHIRITQKKWIEIESLAPADPARAWNSSFSWSPADRPLAQLSFGVNRALAGLEPWSFKPTNLALHVHSGLLVFAFVRLAYRAIAGSRADESLGGTLAVATADTWLLHPIPCRHGAKYGAAACCNASANETDAPDRHPRRRPRPGPDRPTIAQIPTNTADTLIWRPSRR